MFVRQITFRIALFFTLKLPHFTPIKKRTRPYEKDGKKRESLGKHYY